MDLKETEDSALHRVQLAGSKGILQSELWRHLKLNSREGSRIAVKLERQGLVRRVRELSGGRWTYRLYPMDEHKAPDDFSWINLNDCPCFVCVSIKICGAGHVIDPIHCKELETWIFHQIMDSDNENSEDDSEEDYEDDSEES